MDKEKLSAMVAAFAKNGVRASSQEVIDFQDLIGRSKMFEIAEYSQGLESTQRHRFWFAVTAALAPETATEIIRQDARAIAEKHIAEELAKTDKYIVELQDARDRLSQQLEQTLAELKNEKSTAAEAIRSMENWRTETLSLRDRCEEQAAAIKHYTKTLSAVRADLAE